MIFKKKEEIDKEDYIVLSEGQLMLRQFLKHRVAVFSLVILLILYIIVIFADFFFGKRRKMKSLMKSKFESDVFKSSHIFLESE